MEEKEEKLYGEFYYHVVCHHSVHSGGSGSVRALSSMSSFVRDCMEVMGHVTPPYICSLRRGAIVHT